MSSLFMVTIWIVLALFCGSFANDRKLGFAGGFFIALLLSPLIGFIIAAVSDKKTNVIPTTNSYGGEYRQPLSIGVADEIKKLKELYDNGTLSEAEYLKQRNRILQ